jgi:WD40 repeat protein
MFSPDGRRIVGADYRDVKIWDVMTLQEVGVLQGFTKSLNAVTYSPDGSRIVTATEDGEIKIWNAETFECIQTVHFIPGLQLTGVDIRHLHPDSRLTDETRTLLYEYGAIVDDRG